MSFGEKLRILLEEHTMTQKQLAQRCYLTQSYISKLEGSSEDSNPTIKQIITIAKVLELNAYELCYWFLNKEINK